MSPQNWLSREMFSSSESPNAGPCQHKDVKTHLKSVPGVSPLAMVGQLSPHGRRQGRRPLAMAVL